MALLLVLFAVCVAQVVIAVVNGYHMIYFVLGIILPPVASLFMCIWMSSYIQMAARVVPLMYIHHSKN